MTRYYSPTGKNRYDVPNFTNKKGTRPLIFLFYHFIDEASLSYIIMFIKKTILTVVAFVITNANPNAAAAARGIRAESSDSRDDSSASIINSNGNEIYSMVEHDFMADVVQFTLSPSPTHDSMMHGSCVYAKDESDLMYFINSSKDGQVLLCPGKVTFRNEIVLTKSITIECAGPKASCIFDGKENNRHIFSETDRLTFVLVGLSFLNGFADDASMSGPQINRANGAAGGSLNLAGERSTVIIDSCLFYNNLVRSSNFFAVSIIMNSHVKLCLCACPIIYSLFFSL